MTEIPTTEPVAVSPEEETEFERMRADAVVTGRAMSSGEYLAGLIVEAQLETVGRPDKLPADLFPEFPDADPALVDAVWKRGLAVGLHAGRVSASPRLYRDEMARIADSLEAAGFNAMAGLVRRSRALVAPEREGLAADTEAAREH